MVPSAIEKLSVPPTSSHPSSLSLGLLGLDLHEGLAIPVAFLDPVIRSILREDFW